MNENNDNDCFEPKTNKICIKDSTELILPINNENDLNISEPLLRESSPTKENKTINKSTNQFKALFYKSTTLQFKQIGTNICQVFIKILKRLIFHDFLLRFSLP